MRRNRPPWSAADAAEFDVLLDEFVGAAWTHREHCGICSAGGPWCDPLRDAWEGLLVWRRTRELRTIAAFLRAREELAA